MKTQSSNYDVIIVGAGAAGLSAGIYCSRKRLSTIILSVDIGGQTNLTNHIENYPGAGAQPGPELMEKFASEARKFGSEIAMGELVGLQKLENGTFQISTKDGTQLKSRAVILAFGSIPRKLGIPGEEKFFGRGVSVCTTCDAPLFRGKVTAVVGGGNSGVEGALELDSIAKKAYLLQRGPILTADQVSVEKLKNAKNVEVLLNAEVLEILGDKSVKAVKVKVDGKATEIPIDGLFIEIGYEVKTDFLKGLLKINERNEIVTDNTGRTSVPGIFAAGDVTSVPYKQTIISAGEGAKAALECFKYLSEGNETEPDWR
ncbi:MAG: FAD-dependent oxidoreductase [Candidatus Micrarchaeota archaeon]